MRLRGSRLDQRRRPTAARAHFSTAGESVFCRDTECDLAPLLQRSDRSDGVRRPEAIGRGAQLGRFGIIELAPTPQAEKADEYKKEEFIEFLQLPTSATPARVGDVCYQVDRTITSC